MKTAKRLLAALTAVLLLPVAANANVVLVGEGRMNVDTAVPTLLTIDTVETGTITDLDFYIDLQSFFGYDMTVELSHLDTGTSAIIWLAGHLAVPNPFAFGAVRDTTFDDEASEAFFRTDLRDPADGFSILPGQRFRPEELLSIFDGESITGTWQLSLVDNFFPGPADGPDDIISWGITAAIDDSVDPPLPVSEPGTLALLALGLAGLGFARRRKIA